MKILLFCHHGLIREYAQYISAFRKIQPIESILLTMGQEETKLAKELQAFDAVKDILPSKSQLDMADTDPSIASHALRALEQKIGSVFINQDILMDRFLKVQPLLNVDPKTIPVIWTGQRTNQFIHLIAQQIENELESFAPNFMFVEPSIAPSRIAWRLARNKNIPAGGFMSVRFWPERLYLETGLGYDWHDAREAYRALEVNPMLGEELETVTNRLRTVREKKTKPAYLQTEHAKGAPGFLRRLAALRATSGHGSWLGTRAQRSDTDPQVLPSKTYSPWEKYVRYRNGLKAKQYLLRHQTSFERFRGNQYAIYFLHVQPEITVEGMSFDFQDQVDTLRKVLAALPAGMKLVVKEHTPMLGYRPLDTYSQLAHMPGLIIADTREDSHQLIMHAAVVVTLTGTVALEALLYGIPAIVLGSIYFDDFAGIYKPKSLSELKQLLSEPEKLLGASDQDSLRALGSLLRASQPGKPSRVDVTAEGIDNESAQMMLAQLKRACGLL